jgi:hypothetical protein
MKLLVAIAPVAPVMSRQVAGVEERVQRGNPGLISSRSDRKVNCAATTAAGLLESAKARAASTKAEAQATEPICVEESGAASYRQGSPPIECRRIESRVDLVRKRGVLKFAAGYHVFDIIESAWSTLLRKLHHDRWAEFPVSHCRGRLPHAPHNAR